MNSPSNKDLTSEINYFTQRLGTLEFEYFETKGLEKELTEKAEIEKLQKERIEKAQQIEEITEKLAILKEKNKKFHEGSKKRDIFEEAMMKKMFGNLKKKNKSKKHGSKNENRKLVTPKKTFKSFEEKLQQCSNAKEYELIKEKFLEVFQKNFNFEEEIQNWIVEENDIL